MKELSAGLVRFGFFERKDLPEALATEDLLEKNLGPVLDLNGNGIVTADELIFLERDKETRDMYRENVAVLSQFGGIVDRDEVLPHQAHEMLQSIYMTTTTAGGK